MSAGILFNHQPQEALVLRTSSHQSEFANIERRLRALEQRLDRLAAVGAKASVSGASGLMQAADRIADTVVAALGEAAGRMRGSANSVSDEASRFGKQAARLSGDAVQRLTREVSDRPLVMLAVVIGVGALVGLAGVASRRR